MATLAATGGRLAKASIAAVDLAGRVEVRVGEIGDLVQAVETGILHGISGGRTRGVQRT